MALLLLERKTDDCKLQGVRKRKKKYETQMVNNGGGGGSRLWGGRGCSGRSDLG
jgi:hypothetical protein